MTSYGEFADHVDQDRQDRRDHRRPLPEVHARDLLERVGEDGAERRDRRAYRYLLEIPAVHFFFILPRRSASGFVSSPDIGNMAGSIRRGIIKKIKPRESQEDSDR